MKKILCITSGLRGMTNASLELVNRLTNAGHNVHYASNKDIKAIIEKHDIPFHKLDDISLDPGPEIPFRNKILRMLYKQINIRDRKRKALAAMEPRIFIQLIEKEDYDLIIIDIELHEYIISAVSMNTNVLLLSQWFSNWRIKGLPYIMTDAIPTPDFMEDSHWNKVKAKRKRVFKRKKFMSGGSARSIVLHDFARLKGFPEKYMGENLWPGPFLYDEIPVVSMTLPDLEFPHTHRRNLTYVGPMVYDNRKDKIDINLHKQIDLAKSKNQKIIYCSLSTLHIGDIDFINKVILACSVVNDWFLVVSLGGKIDETLFSAPFKNILVRKEVAQLSILTHVHCSINHGGIHTINECIYFAVPMLVYSGKKSDQNGCAARVHYHEAGILADKDIDDVKTITSKIHDILTVSKYKQNMQKYRAQSEIYKQNKTLESFVNEYHFIKEVDV